MFLFTCVTSIYHHHHDFTSHRMMRRFKDWSHLVMSSASAGSSSRCSERLLPPWPRTSSFCLCTPKTCPVVGPWGGDSEETRYSRTLIKAALTAMASTMDLDMDMDIEEQRLILILNKYFEVEVEILHL